MNVSIPLDEEILPPTGIEQATFVEQTRIELAQIHDSIKSVSSVYNIEPISIELNKDFEDKLKTADELCQEAYNALESRLDSFVNSIARSCFISRVCVCVFSEQYTYSALETENNDENEEEEEEEEEEEQQQQEEEETDNDDEGEEEEVDLFKRDRKKNLGDTSIYDPISIVEKNILLPGKPDLIVSYKGQVYRFANEDNRNTFLQAPSKYVSSKRRSKVSK
jgi:YHS domain-containing protein